MVKWGKICKVWGPKFWESIFNLFNFQIPLKRHIFRFLSLPYQWISGLILIKCSHFGPVVLFEQSQSWLIELILGRYNSEEVREASCREHWMSVRVSYLIIIIIAEDNINYYLFGQLYHGPMCKKETITIISRMCIPTI